jgi:hypothetical protein
VSLSRRQPALCAATVVTAGVFLATGTWVGCTVVVDTDGFACEGPSCSSDGGTKSNDEETGAPPNTNPDGSSAGDGGRDGDVPPDASLSPSALYREAVLADEPVAYYRLGERSGIAAKDERKTSDGIYVNPLLGEPSLIQGDDTAARFEGMSVVPIGDVVDVSGTKSFSVELWLRSSGLDSIYRYVFMKEYGGPGPNRRGMSIFVKDSSVTTERYVAGNGIFISYGGLTANTTVHAVATYDGMAVRLYANGVLASANDDVRTITLPITDPAYIGANNSSLSNAFRGTIDEVAVYAKPLTETRIRVHYELGRR